MGIFSAFLDDVEVGLWGVEAAGEGISTGRTAATISAGSAGVLHGSRSLLLQTPDGQVRETHSVSAGLDYPGVGPEHAHLHQTGRARYVPVTDREALDAFRHLAATEGIVPALESAHAVAFARKLAAERSPDGLIVVCLSGRGDKDLEQVRAGML